MNKPKKTRLVELLCSIRVNIELDVDRSQFDALIKQSLAKAFGQSLDKSNVLTVRDPSKKLSTFFYPNEWLAGDGQAAIVWSSEDVRGIRPDLTDDEAYEVIARVCRKHDADLGITWETLKIVADDMFPRH